MFYARLTDKKPLLLTGTQIITRELWPLIEAEGKQREPE